MALCMIYLFNFFYPVSVPVCTSKEPLGFEFTVITLSPPPTTETLHALKNEGLCSMATIDWSKN